MPKPNLYVINLSMHNGDTNIPLGLVYGLDDNLAITDGIQKFGLPSGSENPEQHATALGFPESSSSTATYEIEQVTGDGQLAGLLCQLVGRLSHVKAKYVAAAML